MANPFVLSSVSSITYRGDKVYNKAINLSLCMVVEKIMYKWYPDNTGKPCIQFHFERGGEERWVYDHEKDRDRDFDRITGAHHTQENN